MNKIKCGILALVVATLAACGRQAEEKPVEYSKAQAKTGVPEYRFAVHPLYNPQKLLEAYQPLIDLINIRMQGLAHFELEASKDYQAYEEKFRARGPEFLLPNPWQTLQAMKWGYRVIGTAGDAADFKGIFIVRKDGHIAQAADLKGKIVSYPAPTALAAAIMPQYFLHTHGVNVNKDIENVYVGSQESSIMNVYLRKSAAGATWPPPWRSFQKSHPQEAEQLKVIWETEPLINNSVMVRDDVPPAVADSVQQTLLNLPQTAQGLGILAGIETAHFIAADDASYKVVRDYVDRFEKEVRHVESK